ncbi:hypothetical protein [Marivita sp. GX14005]|uniref:hypothetical protein n=1 Tax=Marivita sp. GX14005 TaxID=2942276 RepID=UPI00201A1B2C|nr:hypothetical protein [Marivita sp. GX14005]MCL3882205.1 hypothetical protein [Marivita sp. GX14005]
MRRLFRFLRSTALLVWLCGALAIGTVTLAFQTFALSAQVAGLTANAASTALRHRKEVTKAVARAKAREKAKARLRRALVAVPFVGGGVAVALEAQDYREWQEANPALGFDDYACDVAALSAEVIDEVLQDLPESLRPAPDAVLGRLPKCDRPI